MYHFQKAFGIGCLAVLLTATDSVAVDLKIVDASGQTVEVKNAYLDYTFLGRLDTVYNGIRVFRGDAEITVGWEKISEVRVTDGDGELALRVGAPTAVKFVGSPYQGSTDLGPFTIGLVMVKSLAVIPNTRDSQTIPISRPTLLLRIRKVRSLK